MAATIFKVVPLYSSIPLPALLPHLERSPKVPFCNCIKHNKPDCKNSETLSFSFILGSRKRLQRARNRRAVCLGATTVLLLSRYDAIWRTQLPSHCSSHSSDHLGRMFSLRCIRKTQCSQTLGAGFTVHNPTNIKEKNHQHALGCSSYLIHLLWFWNFQAPPLQRRLCCLWPVAVEILEILTDSIMVLFLHGSLQITKVLAAVVTEKKCIWCEILMMLLETLTEISYCLLVQHAYYCAALCSCTSGTTSAPQRRTVL